MFHRTAAKCCTSSKIFQWKETSGSRILLIVAILTVLSFIENSMAMPPREYGAVERVYMTRMTYRGSREPVDEDEDEEPPIASRFPEYRTGRGENRSRGDSRNNQRDSGYRHEPEINQRSNFLAIPESDCEGKTFCESTISDYPEEYIRNIISTTSSLNALSGVDEIDINAVPNINTRIQDGEIVCDAETKVVFPKVAQTKNNEWLFVVQDETSGFKQGVRVENCGGTMDKGTCQIVEDQVPGYKTSCKQKYVSRVLATIDRNGATMMEKFNMPSSCCCEIRVVKTPSRFLQDGLRNDQTPAPIRKRGRSH